MMHRFVSFFINALLCLRSVGTTPCCCHDDREISQVNGTGRGGARGCTQREQGGFSPADLAWFMALVWFPVPS